MQVQGRLAVQELASPGAVLHWEGRDLVDGPPSSLATLWDDPEACSPVSPRSPGSEPTCPQLSPVQKHTLDWLPSRPHLSSPLSWDHSSG